MKALNKAFGSLFAGRRAPRRRQDTRDSRADDAVRPEVLARNNQGEYQSPQQSAGKAINYFLRQTLIAAAHFRQREQVGDYGKPASVSVVINAKNTPASAPQRRRYRRQTVKNGTKIDNRFRFDRLVSSPFEKTAPACASSSCGEDAAASCFSARRAASDSPSSTQAQAAAIMIVCSRAIFSLMMRCRPSSATPAHTITPQCNAQYAHHRFFTRTADKAV